ncbi:MAG: 2-hydroxy-3-oxopropionate reductase [Chloroflexi bacterium]|nr:2-hydroxy-3-oxopropionate reductase [Chloroflexota bacterium]OJV95311.1 MAG: 2-hydroxy-3-oxopropionate reductase [Chloroflexi bacterium 54-19]
MPDKIGFIGLGIMGKPMAHNLLKAEYDLTVFNRSQQAIEELVAAGAKAAENPRQVAEKADVLITMLPDSPDVEAVLAGENGVLAGLKPGGLLIDMSTISPVVSRKLAEAASQQGISMLDAPVSGGDKGAIAGTLSIMVGGSEADYERALPIFQALGKTITYCGPNGAGQTVKACNQVVVALTIEAVSEALVLGTKAGVDPEIILKVLGGGLAQNRVMEMRGPNFIQHKYEPGFKVKLHHKDLGIVLDTAKAFGLDLPVTPLVDGMLAALIDQGKGELDHSALLEVVEEHCQSKH